MRKAVILASLLIASPALAQQAPVQPQIDSATATVTRIVIGLGNQIATDAATIEMQQRQIDALRQQVDTLTKERDAAKATQK